MSVFDPYWFPCDAEVLGIPHFANVTTNLAFGVVGAWGLVLSRRLGRAAGASVGAWPWIWLAAVGIGLGSAAYHLWLTPATLAVDRAAICAFGGLFLYHALVVGRVVRPSLLAALACVLAFEATVVVWLLGATSLVYGVAQLAGAVAVLVLYVRRVRPAYPSVPLKPILLFYGFYALAKVAEAADQAVCTATGVVGGHPVKHLLAAAGMVCLLRLMRREYEVADAS